MLLRHIQLPLPVNVNPHYVTDGERCDMNAIVDSNNGTGPMLYLGTPGNTLCCGAKSVWAYGFNSELLYNFIRTSKASVILYHGSIKNGMALKPEDRTMDGAIASWNIRAKDAARFTWSKISEREGVIVVQVLDLAKHDQWKFAQ